MELFFLRSSDGIPATKTYYKDSTGKICRSGYNNIYKFTSSSYSITTIEEFHHLITHHANYQNCLLKGKLKRPLNAESRAGSTNPQDDTGFITLDIDDTRGYDNPEKWIKDCLPEEFHNVSYIWQPSASAGFKRGLNGHLFFMLEHEISAPVIKEWLTLQNLTNDILCGALTLSKNAVTLKYSLDITASQNDKLNYIAPPILKDGIEDPFRGKERITLVKKEKDLLNFSFPINPAQAQELRDQAIDLLRRNSGMRKRTAKYTTFQNQEILENPQPAIVTGPIRHERGFVYLNINHGDSYGYYHPENNPSLLYNFKGEPIVKIEKFLPDYWKSLKKTETTSITPVVFRERKTDTYFNGTYDEGAQKLDLFPVSSKDRINDFMAGFGEGAPNHIQDFDYEFNPQENYIYDPDHCRANRFVMTDYLRNAPEVKECPPTILKLVESICGYDQKTVDHYLNWIAAIYQYRIKLGTAFAHQGVEGTGKGVMFHKVHKPLLGERYCHIATTKEFDDNFNGWMEECLFCMVDEVKADNSNKKLVNTFKNLITEPTITIRKMRTNPYQAKSYMNLCFASNELDALYISETDRRFNISPRQEHKLVVDDEFMQNIDNELMQMAGFLMHYEVDMEAARKPLDNEAKQTMREAAQNSVEQFFYNLKEGNLDFFLSLIDNKPSIDDQLTYNECVRALKRWVANVGSSQILTREEIIAVYRYIQSNKSVSTNSFTKLMGHNNLHIIRLRVPPESVEELGSERVYGIEVNFTASDEAIETFNRPANVSHINEARNGR